MQLKAESDIFIDQLVYGNNAVPLSWGKKRYNGALGKSGCEAMFLNTMVITGAAPPNLTTYDFPDPPVPFVRFDEFEKILERLVCDHKKRVEYTHLQYEWAREYLTHKFVAKHVMGDWV